MQAVQAPLTSTSTHSSSPTISSPTSNSATQPQLAPSLSEEDEILEQLGAAPARNLTTGTTKSRMTLSQHPLFAAKVQGLRLRVLRFTPSWFSVTMGTGICNTLLFDIPFERVHPAFRIVGACFLLLDIILFLSFLMITIARYAFWPRIWKVMIHHETHSLFLGCIPMGMVTIVTGIARTGNEYGLGWTLELTIVLWWICLVLSVLTSFCVPYMMFTSHANSQTSLTAAWLLPVVPPITIAASGSTFTTLLTEADRLGEALTVLLASYVMCGVGLLLGCGLMVIYFERLALHHLPPREVIVSTFLPLGPCGQGGFALIELGRAAMRLFPLLVAAQPTRSGFDDLGVLGPAMFGAGVVSGLLLWGLGMWWAFLAVVSVGSHYLEKQIAFNMGWWAFTFPLGSLTLLTYSLGTTFDSLFFKVVAVMMTFCVVLLWSIVFVPTALGFFGGTLFPAPCLQSLPKEYVEKLPLGLAKGKEEAVGVRDEQIVSVGPAAR